jgi:cytochrome c6
VTLRAIDRVLAAGSWLVAAALVVMLLIGPKVVANDKGAKPASAGSPYGSQPKAAAVDGAKVFKDNCGSCHTLSAAGTSGVVGPKLDGLALDAATVQQALRDGPGAMPSFAGQLSAAQLAAVAKYVADSSH